MLTDSDKYLKLYQEALEKRKDRIEFLNHIAPKAIKSLDDVNSAELIGFFVVYEQLLEENLELILSTVYEYKAAASNGKSIIIRNAKFKDLTLGALKNELSKILFHKTVGHQEQEDLLQPLKDKLSTFVTTRNDYIHRLLQQNLKLHEFKTKLIEAIVELAELVDESANMRAQVNKHYDFDGNSPLSIAGHLISKDATKKG